MLLFLSYTGRFLLLTWSKQLQRNLLILSTMVLLHIMVSAVFSTCHKVDKMIIDKLPVQYLERKPQFPCRYSILFKLEFRNVGFSGDRKHKGVPQENRCEQGKNQHHTMAPESISVTLLGVKSSYHCPNPAPCESFTQNCWWYCPVIVQCRLQTVDQLTKMQTESKMQPADWIFFLTELPVCYRFNRW